MLTVGDTFPAFALKAAGKLEFPKLSWDAKQEGDILLLTEEIRNPLIKEEAIGEAGLALKNMGRNELALVQYRKGLEVNSRNLTFRREEAFNLNRLGRVDEAIVKIENLLADVPTDTEAIAYLGRIYKEMWRDSWKWVEDKDLRIRTAFEKWDAIALRDQRRQKRFGFFTALLGPVAVLLLTVQILAFPHAGPVALELGDYLLIAHFVAGMAERVARLAFVLRAIGRARANCHRDALGDGSGYARQDSVPAQVVICARTTGLGVVHHPRQHGGKTHAHRRPRSSSFSIARYAFASVCASMPWAASTTSSAPSQAWSDRDTSYVKSTCPGVSMRLSS